MRRELWFAFALVWVALAFFTAGVRYERAGNEEYLKSTACPENFWRYSWCVPTGCAVDLATYPPSWDCGSRSYQEMHQ